MLFVQFAIEKHGFEVENYTTPGLELSIGKMHKIIFSFTIPFVYFLQLTFRKQVKIYKITLCFLCNAPN